MYNSCLAMFYALADNIIANSFTVEKTIGDKTIVDCVTHDYQNTHFIITYYKGMLVDIKRDIY